MRLLHRNDFGDLALAEFIEEIPPYAILSHRWTFEEVTIADIEHGTGRTKSGFVKVRFCEQQAAKDGLQYFWIDSCCIDQKSSAEVSEAINSMFRWYQNSTKCYVYMSDFSRSVSQRDRDLAQPYVSRALKDLRETGALDSFTELEGEEVAVAFVASEWFTRGWTLQELLAAPTVEFFDGKGRRLVSKHDNVAVELIHHRTSIPREAILGTPLSNFTFKERISWAKDRRTLREEDRIYSMLGIFGVFMPIIYGEGVDHAYARLKQAVRKAAKDAALKE